jgi:hypothetical protein
MIATVTMELAATIIWMNVQKVSVPTALKPAAPRLNSTQIGANDMAAIPVVHPALVHANQLVLFIAQLPVFVM